MKPIRGWLLPSTAFRRLRLAAPLQPSGHGWQTRTAWGPGTQPTVHGSTTTQSSLLHLRTYGCPLVAMGTAPGPRWGRKSLWSRGGAWLRPRRCPQLTLASSLRACGTRKSFPTSPRASSSRSWHGASRPHVCIYARDQSAQERHCRCACAAARPSPLASGHGWTRRAPRSRTRGAKPAPGSRSYQEANAERGLSCAASPTQFPSRGAQPGEL